MPSGIGGPFSRQLSDRAGIAIAWGLGIGLYGTLIVASAAGVQRQHRLAAADRRAHPLVYPGVDLSQPSGVLQLTFFGFGSFIFSLAGASFLAGWATDEGRRRLEVVLTTPLSRAQLGRPERPRGAWPRSAW